MEAKPETTGWENYTTEHYEPITFEKAVGYLEVWRAQPQDGGEWYITTSTCEYMGVAKAISQMRRVRTINGRQQNETVGAPEVYNTIVSYGLTFGVWEASAECSLFLGIEKIGNSLDWAEEEVESLNAAERKNSENAELTPQKGS